uniref:Family with sequence similarity 50 member B n=1 Tax=Oryctolagus cuniculus TaxID=9986 RepID=G1TLG3_RABIT
MAQYKGTMREAGRAMHLIQKREKQKAQLQVLKQRIAEETISKCKVDKQFSAHYDAVEAELKSSTVGLVTLNDMKAKQEALVREREAQLGAPGRSVSPAPGLLGSRRPPTRQVSAAPSFFAGRRRRRRRQRAGPEGPAPPSGTWAKKPGTWDTSFLPDREREEAREPGCARSCGASEAVDVTFSYWDGSGHRRTARMRKGSTVQQFLKAALQGLRKDFRELRAAGVEQLMYVKEDLILPHHHTFYDFIVARARGKSGPLFSFDVHDDVRLRSDATREKDESHAGKVVLRSWYEKNKHIFPASRWEPYDPERRWDRYTVR